MDSSTTLDEQGYFWWREEKYPNDHFAPENHVTGWLKISINGEIRLELDGVLPSDEHPLTRIAGNRSAGHVPRMIQGVTKDTGKRVLLLDAVGNGGRFNSNSFSFERYSATMCLIGNSDFPKRRASPLFSTMEIDLTGFENWLLLGTLDLRRTRRSVTLRMDEARDIVFNTPAGKLVLEKHTEVIEPNGLHRFEAKVREFMTLVVRKTPAMTSEQIRTEYTAIQDLLTLLTDSHYSLAWPAVQISGSKKYYSFVFRRLGSSANPPGIHDMSLHLPKIKEKFGEMYAAWRIKREEFGAGFYSYLSTRRDIKLYVENQFINLVQGLESFHRTKYGSTIPASSLQAKIDRILGDVKLEKDRTWLERKLRHSAEPTLEERLFVLVKSLPFRMGEDQIRTFVAACAHLRNDLAHFGGQRTRQSSADFLQEISTKSDALGFFYHMLLLREIGLEDRLINDWLKPGLASMRARAALAKAGFTGKNLDGS